MTLSVIKLQDKADFKSYIMHNHGQDFDIESKEVSPANKYKTMADFATCKELVTKVLVSNSVHDNKGMHWVASCIYQAKYITEQLEGRRTNTYFHLMGGEVDLEEYSEFSFVDSDCPVSFTV